MAKVNIIAKERSGTVQYIEGSLFKKSACEFYWEFGDAAWDAKYPWAAGRRMEIMREMAERVRKKQTPSSTLK